MNRKIYIHPLVTAVAAIQLEEDFLQGASAVGTVLATGQGVEEYSAEGQWEDGDIAWD